MIWRVLVISDCPVGTTESPINSTVAQEEPVKRVEPFLLACAIILLLLSLVGELTCRQTPYKRVHHQPFVVGHGDYQDRYYSENERT